MDRISPSTLRLVVLGLTACAGVGLWMGLSDSLRRDAPAWESGYSPAPVPSAGPPEAVPFDPKAESRPARPAAPPPAAKPPEAKTVDPAAPSLTGPAEIGAPAALPPAAKAPAPRTPAAKAPAPKTAPDPIGDLVEEKTAPAQPPPEVPF